MIDKYNAILLLAFSGTAIAGSATYDCTIKHVYKLSEKGVLITSNWQSDYQDNEFTVSRSTGAITGQTLTTILAEETQVINSGSKENSFKAIAYFKGQVQIIEIQEFKSGKIKPFVTSSMGGAGIVTGTCI